MMETTTPGINFKLLIHKPRTEIWPLISTAEGFCKWFTSEMKLDPHPGGAMEFAWLDYGPDKQSARENGRVVDIVENEGIEFEWINRGEFRTNVRLKLTDHAEGCVITLRESGLPEGEKGLLILLDNGPGWGHAIANLKAFVESGFRSEHIR